MFTSLHRSKFQVLGKFRWFWISVPATQFLQKSLFFRQFWVFIDLFKSSDELLHRNFAEDSWNFRISEESWERFLNSDIILMWKNREKWKCDKSWKMRTGGVKAGHRAGTTFLSNQKFSDKWRRAIINVTELGWNSKLWIIASTHLDPAAKGCATSHSFVLPRGGL